MLHHRFAVEPKRVPATHISDALESLPILNVGSCEPLKATIHAAALGLCALMGLYNAAAWLKRRQPRLAINAVVYLAATYWEQRHVAEHVIRCIPAEEATSVSSEGPVAAVSSRAA